MSVCQAAVATTQAVENEGNGNPAAPNEGNGVNATPAPPAPAPAPAPVAVNPYHLYPMPYPASYEPDPGYNAIDPVDSRSYDYVPVCQWTCRRVRIYPVIKICDDMHGVHPSDCEFYKAVCRAEMRGMQLNRVPCQRSYFNPNSKRRQTWLKK